MADPAWVFDVLKVFNDAGVPPEVWVPIMLHESGANPNAENNTIGKQTPAGTVPEWSIGLFQINVHAKGLDPAAEGTLAAQLKDPVTNAKYAAAAMGPAWANVKDTALQVDRRYWSWLVGIRSGWPGGSIDHPCMSDYCMTLKEGFAGVFDRWFTAWNAQGAGDIISPYFHGGSPATTGGNSGGTGGGGPADVGSTGTVPNATGGGGYTPGGSSTTDTSGAFSWVNTQTAINTAVHNWLQSDSAMSVLFFTLGFLLLILAVLALLFERGKAGAESFVKFDEAAISGLAGAVASGTAPKTAVRQAAARGAKAASK